MTPANGAPTTRSRGRVAPDAGDAAQPRWRSRRVRIGGAVVAVVVVAGIIVLVSGGGSSSPAVSATGHSSTVTRRNLVSRQSVDGTLGYANPITISAAGGASSTSSSAATSAAGGGAAGGSSSSSGSTSSTITSIAPEGSVVTLGQTLFAINGEPTVLLFGSTPMYRQLSTSSTAGPDILQLEYDLKALGYNPGTVDDTYTSATASAVQAWETNLGRSSPDGVVALGEVVFEQGPVRIGAHVVEVGETVASGGAVMNITGTAHVVTVNLDATQQSLVKPFGEALITFPDGSSATAVIASVGKVATSTSSSTGTAGAATAAATIPVTIVFPAGAKVPDLDQAPVTVGITSEARSNVLAVPVTALLALAEGGYGVEVVQPSGATTIVAVQVGVYADSYVEVSGNGISEGTRVVTG